MTHTCTDLTCKYRYTGEPQLILVKWSDASYQSGGPLAINEINREVLIWTAGILVEDSETHYSIALDFYEVNTTWRYICHIPKGMVLETYKIPWPERKENEPN